MDTEYNSVLTIVVYPHGPVKTLKFPNMEDFLRVEKANKNID